MVIESIKKAIGRPLVTGFTLFLFFYLYFGAESMLCFNKIKLVISVQFTLALLDLLYN